MLDVPDADVDEAAASLADIGLPTEASAFRRGVISCTGIQLCKLAIVETKERAAEITSTSSAASATSPGRSA